MNLANMYFVSLLVLLLSWCLTEDPLRSRTSRRLTKIVSKKDNHMVGSDKLKLLDPVIFFKYITVKHSDEVQKDFYRGIDKVFYVEKGEGMYVDFRGHSNPLSAGDVIWNTGGKGLVHAIKTNSTIEGYEIMMNNDDSYKMVEHFHQFLSKSSTPIVEMDGVLIKVIAGRSVDSISPIITLQGSMFLDIYMEKGRELQQDIPYAWNACIYVIEGSVSVGDQRAKQGEIGVLSQWDYDVTFKAQKDSRFLLLGGLPVRELMVQFGNFIMKNYPTIQEAINDYKFGRNGFEGADTWNP